jgi:hypothetical protein
MGARLVQSLGMDPEPLVTTRDNFVRFLMAIGFQRGTGWDHEVWCDVETTSNNFWVHFQAGDDPLEIQAGGPGECEYRINPDVSMVDLGAFVRFWREACVEEAVESALEANRRLRA